MKSLQEYSALVAEAVSGLQLPSKPAGLYDPIRYTLDGGGKRLRPVLLIATSDALGRDAADVMSQALGIEMFHNFTLLHDDVMDRAETRRGRMTVHRRWNVETAILSGDAMLTLAGQLMARGAREGVVDAFNEAAIKVYEGQQYDMDFEHTSRVSVDDYLNMISLKTGALISAATRIGAMMATDDARVVDAFATYGDMLGMAFQLQDDYLDTYGGPATFGKAIGGDIVNDKKTWFQIMALANDHRGEASSLIGVPVPPDVKINRMRQIYDRLDLPEMCHQLIEDYLRKAMDAISGIGLSGEAVEFFSAVARQSATRKA